MQNKNQSYEDEVGFSDPPVLPLEFISAFSSMTCLIPSWYPWMKHLNASLYDDARIIYMRCKTGLKVSIPPLAATAVYRKNKQTYKTDMVCIIFQEILLNKHASVSGHLRTTLYIWHA